jgi:triacylglycerol lipase
MQPGEKTGKPRIMSRKLGRLLASFPGRRDDAVSILNGFLGDVLEESGSSLAIPMTLRSHGMDLTLDSAALPRFPPEARSRVCLLIHGMMANESFWEYPGDPGKTYGSLLSADASVTPVYVRYNTGRHISTNAQELSRLLNDLVACWPVEIEEISFVGHSMGGLIARSACHHASINGQDWVDKVRRFFLIGVPSSGAPLEKLANITSFTLTTIANPWTRLISRIIRLRSAGIKDLRVGLLVDEDWQGEDPDRLLPGKPYPVPLLGHAEHFVVAGSVWKDTKHPVAKILGDAMVSQFSARGQRVIMRDAGPFQEENVRVFPRLNHMALVHSDEVYKQILEWWRQS